MWKAAFSVALTTVKSVVVGIYRKVFKKKPLSIEEVKRLTQVLFIDDESFDSLLNNIRDSGWNVKQKQDIDNLDAEDIKNADIIFIDYKDVGIKLTPTEEGIGLLKAMRNKYPNKRLIFYSGYAGFIPGHEIHDIANGWISKNADPYVYIERIESEARKVYGIK